MKGLERTHGAIAMDELEQVHGDSMVTAMHVLAEGSP